MADYQGIFGGGGGGGAVASVVGGTGITIDNTDPANPIITNTSLNTDETAKVSSNDTTAGYLNGKLVAGTGITFTENNNGGNETLTVTLGSHTHAASDVTSGVFDVTRLGTGTANNTVFLRGDGTWATPSGGITGFTSDVNTTSPNLVTWSAVRLQTAHAGSNNDIVLQAKGTGAHLAQTPDNSTTGGNKRGEYAVDWQKVRSYGADRVASGSHSVIGGGESNQASANWAVVAGGAQCRAQGAGSFIGGGTVNTASGSRSVVAGGQSNQATQSWATIGGGETNTANNTYATIAGGKSNTASGAYAFIGGGQSHTNSGAYGVIVGGFGNNNASSYGFIGGGDANVVNANNGAILGGSSNTIGTNADSSVALGRNAYTRCQAEIAMASHTFGTQRGGGSSIYNLAVRTTDANPTVLSSWGGASVSNNTTIALDGSSVVTFKVLVTAKQQISNNVGGWEITGVAYFDGTTVNLFNVTSHKIHSTVGGWNATVVNGGVSGGFGRLAVQVSGATGANIQWHAMATTTYTIY